MQKLGARHRSRIVTLNLVFPFYEGDHHHLVEHDPNYTLVCSDRSTGKFIMVCPIS